MSDIFLNFLKLLDSSCPKEKPKHLSPLAGLKLKAGKASHSWQSRWAKHIPKLPAKKGKNATLFPSCPQHPLYLPPAFLFSLLGYYVLTPFHLTFILCLLLKWFFTSLPLTMFFMQSSRAFSLIF